MKQQVKKRLVETEFLISIVWFDNKEHTNTWMGETK